MRMTKFYAWVLAAAMAVAGFAGCTDEENDNNGEGTKEPTEQEGMPEYLYEGTAVVFSTMSPLMFGYFKVTGLGEGQWAASEGDGAVIAPGFPI